MASSRQCSLPACSEIETEEKKFMRCTRCKASVYCSAACQRQHWPTHKPVCKAPGATPPEPAPAAPSTPAASARDFDFGEEIGIGSFARVVKATRRSTGETYALKIMSKRHLLREKKVENVKREKDILLQIEHPHVVRLAVSFQDETSLYLAFELCPGGDLFEVLQQCGTLTEECAHFFLGEVLSAVVFLHSKNIIHRDIKPENMLLTEARHIKLCDFGSAALAGSDGSREFVGTAQYLAPEVIDEHQAVFATDLWSFGAVLFHVLAGRAPFRGSSEFESEYLTWQAAQKLDYTFPEDFPPLARDLVEHLLVWVGFWGCSLMQGRFWSHLSGSGRMTPVGRR
mmetsp:Transcript_2814/g.5938  ORF Transcript_2814/g.5938 Transcript_2814/m.5938 type:complete len:342 (-) Transcript_2814:149-1174(-)